MGVARRALGACSLALALATVLAPSAAADIRSVPAQPRWGTDGVVTSLAQVGGNTWLGGFFSNVVRPSGGGLLLDFATGEPKPFPVVAGIVELATPDGDGGVYFAGSFAAVGGVPRNGLAHVRADGTVDPVFGSDLPNVLGDTIRAIEVGPAAVYVGGRFTSVGGHARNHLAAFDRTTGALLPFNPPSLGKLGTSDPYVNAIAVGSGPLYAAGTWGDVGGDSARQGLVALDPLTGALVSSFNPKPDSGDEDALALQGSTLYVSGEFNAIGGQPRVNFGALDTATGDANGFAPSGLTSPPTSIAAGATRVYAVSFLSEPRAFAPADGAKIATFNSPDFGFAFYSRLALDANTLYVTGDFEQDHPAGQSRPGLAALAADTGALKPLRGDFVPALGGSVSVAVPLAGGLFVGGIIAGTDPRPRSNLAELGPSGDPTDAAPDPDGHIDSLLADESGLYVGGEMSNIAGAARNALARLDGTSGAIDPSFSSPFTTGDVVSLARVGGTLYVGGLNSTVSSTSGFYALEAGSGALEAAERQLSVDDTVHALLASAGRLYLGGSFTKLGTQAQLGLGAIDLATDDPVPGVPAVDAAGGPFGSGGAVGALAEAGGRLWVGGFFSKLGSAERHGLAAIDPATGAVSAVRADTAGSESFDGVLALAAFRGQLVVGGAYFALAGVPRISLAALDPATGVPSAFDPSIFGTVAALLADGAMLRVGGQFYATSPFAASGYAIYPEGAAGPAPPRISLDPKLVRQPLKAPLIVSGPRRRTRAHRARLRFSGTSLRAVNVSGETFQCRLDHGHYRFCGSTKHYSRLRAGRHVFAVRSVRGTDHSTASYYHWRVLRADAHAVIHFGPNAIVPTADAQAQLRALARHSLHGRRTVRCDGHAAMPGDVSILAPMIARLRALAVCGYLRAHGVHARLIVRSFGSRRPVASNHTPAGLAANRRVEIRAGD